MAVVTILDTRNRRMNIDSSDTDVQRTLRILGWKPSNFSQLNSGKPMVVSTKEFQALLPHSIKAPAAPVRPVKAPKQTDPTSPTAKEQQVLNRAHRAAVDAGRDYMADFISDYRNNVSRSGLNSFDEAPEAFASDLADGVLSGFGELDNSPRRRLFLEIIADYVATGMYETLKKSGL